MDGAVLFSGGVVFGMVVVELLAATCFFCRLLLGFGFVVFGAVVMAETDRFQKAVDARDILFFEVNAKTVVGFRPGLEEIVEVV